MTANVDAMVRAGVEAYRAGKKAEARTLLERALELDQYNESAWLWLSAVVETREEQQTCLENVLVINPQNDRARQGLKSLGIDPESVLNAMAKEEASAAAETFEEDPFSAPDDGYSVPTSSASSDYVAPEVSASEYDNWVAGLNLGSSATPERTTGDVFGGSDFDSSEDDILGDDVFGDDINFDNTDSFDTNFDSYDADATYDVDYGSEELDTAYEYEDTGYDDYDDSVSTDFGDDLFAADDDDVSEFEGAMDQGMFDDYDADEFAGDPFAEENLPEPEAEPTIDEYFRMIPAGITPTRLPGTDELIPSRAKLITRTLIFLNLGALVFVLYQFFIG